MHAMCILTSSLLNTHLGIIYSMCLDIISNFCILLCKTGENCALLFLHRVWLPLKLTSKKVSGIDVTVVIECMLFIIKKEELIYIEMFRN